MALPKRPAAALALILTLAAALPTGAVAGTSTGAACSDTLINGGFEAGQSGWTQSSAGGFDLISDFNPRSGVWGAYLAGYDDADDRLSQTLDLPSGTITATLRLWWMLETEEAGLGNDHLDLALLRPNGTTLADLWTGDDSAPTGIWSEVVIDLTPYAGQQVRLQLRAATNSLDLTDFYADDITLTVCTPGNAAQRRFLPLIVRN